MQEWRRRFDAIARDNIHGATYLLQEAIEVLKTITDSRTMREATERLVKVQPYMAPFYRLALAIEERGYSVDADFFAKWWQEFETEQRHIAQEAAALISHKRVLVHSMSSHVYQTLFIARDIEVVCTESRPKNEGVALCKKLHRQGIPTTLIIDAAAGYMMEHIDVVLLGADGIGSFGLVHKIGTYLIALAAREHKKEIVLLAPRQKWWPENFTLPSQPKKEGREISEECEASNYYFDVTPLRFITKIVR